MRVLALTSSYPTFVGDSTAPFIEAITTGVATLGHEVHLVAPQHREWRHAAVEGGVHYHTYRYSPFSNWTPWGYSASLQDGVKIKRSLYPLAPIVALSALHACSALTSKLSFDVVHAHWVVPNGVIASRVAGRRGIPLVISLHGSDVTLTQRTRVIGAEARRSLARADVVSAASQYVLERARELGIADDRLALLPYGVDVNRFRPDAPSAAAVRERLGFAEADVVVLGIGRLVEWKGFRYLLDAISVVQRTHPSVRLLMVGDGDLRETLEARAASLGLGPHVVFTGDVPHSEVPAYFAAADIVAVPSIYHVAGFFEALGNVALEGLASGKPVVASRVGGLVDVVRDSENGYLVEHGSADALADRIAELVGNAHLRSRLGAAAREHAEASLSWPAAAERVVSAYERAGRKG